MINHDYYLTRTQRSDISDRRFFGHSTIAIFDKASISIDDCNKKIDDLKFRGAQRVHSSNIFSSKTDLGFEKSIHCVFNYDDDKGFFELTLDNHMRAIYTLERRDGNFASAYSFFMMDRFLDDYCFDEADEFLKRVNVMYLTSWSIVALLRSTYMVKHLLPSWLSFYIESKKYLLDKNEDVEELLCGLED
jgi:hypothetical protein